MSFPFWFWYEPGKWVYLLQLLLFPSNPFLPHYFLCLNISHAFSWRFLVLGFTGWWYVPENFPHGRQVFNYRSILFHHRGELFGCLQHLLRVVEHIVQGIGVFSVSKIPPPPLLLEELLLVGAAGANKLGEAVLCFDLPSIFDNSPSFFAGGISCRCGVVKGPRKPWGPWGPCGLFCAIGRRICW